MTAGTTASGQDLGVAVSDLRQLDWDAAPLPPGFCGIPTVTPLDGGMARTASETWGEVTVAVEQVTFGDLLEDDAEEAALDVYCDNGGGTAASTLEYGIAVFAGRGGKLISLGTLTAQVQDAGEMPTLLSVVEWRDHSLVVAEHYYRSADATCCPSGTAETTWTWTGDVPSPGAPHVLR